MKLYGSLDTGLKKSIWQHARYISPVVDSVITTRSVDLTMQGRYMTFLLDVAEKDPYFSKYVEVIQTHGSLAPSLTLDMARNSAGLDFSNERHQLILAIHFLTVNDEIANTPE